MSCLLVLVGIVGAAAIAFGILYIRRRKKAQDEDFSTRLIMTSSSTSDILNSA